jgi:cytochrome P450
LLLHDPNVYANPDEFNPDRFISTKTRQAERDPHEIAFGFGRRTCPGRHVADASIFLSVASILAALHISKTIENGKVVEPVVEPSSGGIRYAYFS